MNPYIVFYTFPCRGWIGWNHWNPSDIATDEETVNAEFKAWVCEQFASAAGIHYMVCHRTKERGM